MLVGLYQPITERVRKSKVKQQHLTNSSVFQLIRRTDYLFMTIVGLMSLFLMRFIWHPVHIE